MSRRLVIGASLAVLLAWSVAVRVIPARDTVFPGPDDVRLLGVDAYYHLRHTQFAAKHFPHLQRWDVGTHYPTGQRAKAAGLHDLWMATAALVVGAGHPSDDTVRRVVAFTPPVLGALALMALFLVLRRVADPWTGLLGCALVSVFPGGFLTRTTLGYADHHASEVLWVLLAAYGVVDCLTQAAVAPSRWRRAIAEALPMAILVFTWIGAPLHIVTFGTALVAVQLLAIAQGQGVRALGAAVFRYGVALLVMVGAAGLLWPTAVMIPELFPYILIGSAVLAVVPLALATGAGLLTARGVGAGLAAAVLLLATIAVAALAVAVVPGASSLGALLLEPRHPLVAEHLRVGSALFWQNLGVHGVLALPAPLVLALAAYRDRRYRPALFLALVGLFLIGVWWRTRDYGYAIPPFSGLMAALAVWMLLGRLAKRGWARAGAYVALGCAVLVPIWPSRSHPPPWPLPLQLSKVTIVNDGWSQAMRWMARETPEPTLPIDARVEPFGADYHFPRGSYGVVVSWDFGSIVAACGRRVPVASQGVSTPVATWMLLDDEEEAIDFWERRTEPGERVRYVVLDAETLGDHFVGLLYAAGQRPIDYAQLETPLPIYGEAYHATMAARLYVGAGIGMKHYRLIYQSPHKSALYYQNWSDASGADQGRFRLRSESIDSAEERARFEMLVEQQVVPTADGHVYRALIAPTVRIFEVVRGATIRGTTSAGATVEARLPLRSGSDGHLLTYRQRVSADAAGRFVLVLPYSTDGRAPADVASLGLYQIRVDRGDGQGLQPVVQIGAPEEYVQRGEALDLGDLDRGPPSPSPR